MGLPGWLSHAPVSKGKLKLTCLGTGDGRVSADRGHSSFLYELEGTRLLVDCGEPVSRRLKSTGVGADDLDGIFLSHLHCDHSGGLFMLMQGLWLDRRCRALTLHLPAEGIEPIQAMLRAAYIFDGLLEFDTTWQPLKVDEVCQVKTVRVTPHLTSHLHSLRDAFQAQHPQAFEAFSFVLEAGGLRLGHSADIGALADLDPLTAEPLDLLVCEMAHCDPEGLLDYLAGREVKEVAFTHVHQKHLPRLGEIQAMAAGRVNCRFVADGEVIEL